MTEAKLAESEVLKALRLKQRGEVGLERVVQDFVGNFLGGQQIGDGENLRFGNPCGQGAVRCNNCHFQRAELDTLGHFTLAAELGVRIDLNGDATVGQFLYLFLEEVGSNGRLMLLIASGTEFDLIGGGRGILAVRCGGVLAPAGCKGEDHSKGKQKGNQLFHFHLSSSVIMWIL